MANIRIVAAAAIVALAFTLAPVSARTCDDSACAETNPGAPLHLDQFLKHERMAKPARTAHKKSTAAKPAPESSAPVESPSEPAEQETDVAADAALVANPVKTIETDGVAVTSTEELNEIDALADKVKVVSADEVNEIDLTADTTSASPPSLSQEPKALEAMASADAPATQDLSWIGKLLAAFGGSIAVAAAARLLLA